MKDNSRSRGIALKLGRKRGWVVSFKPRSLYPKDCLDILKKRKKNLAPPVFELRTVQPVA
jgi:hypothetical protein